jgi:quercetin dioxygenase-like cupin family protein
MHETVRDVPGIFVEPPMDAATVLPGLTVLTLVRRPPFQLEVVVLAPNVAVPMHGHPDVESCEIGFAGDLELSVDGSPAVIFRGARRDGISRLLGRYVYIPAGAMHGGRTGPLGASFLTAQRWLNGVQPVCVVNNWCGPPFANEDAGQGTD